MHQSLYLTYSFERSVHFTSLKIITRLGLNEKLSALLFSVSIPFEDLVLFYIPGGYGWLHEEWHRAILTKDGVSSFDEIYNFPIFSKYIAISNVSDDDLAMMKAFHPFDFIRSFEAGVEGQFYLTEIVRDNCFFSGDLCIEELSQLWMNIANSSAYIFLSGTKFADKEIERMERSEGENVSKRDYAGFDFTSWTYHLFHPLQPYDELGVDPSGVGVKRYIKFSDLSVKERKFLKLQGILTWLNLISPQLIGIKDLGGWNFYLTHYLTSWGYMISGNLLLKKYSGIKSSFAANFNLRHIFPSFGIKLTDLGVADVKVSLSVKGWIQPVNFFSNRGRAGGSVDVTTVLPAGRKAGFLVNMHLKTSGWEQGEEFLGRAFSIRMGFDF